MKVDLRVCSNQRRIVELVRAGRSPRSVAREFEPSEQTIRNWVKQADLDEGRRSDGLTTEARKEMQRLRRQPSARARRDAELKDRILAKWIESGGIYGCPRIHAVLLAEGERVSRKRVARLMRELGIEGVTRRRFKTGTTKRDAKARPAPDLVNRDFSARGPTSCGWPTSRRCAHGRDGCTSPWCSTRGVAASSAGRWRRACRPNWWATR